MIDFKNKIIFNIKTDPNGLLYALTQLKEVVGPIADNDSEDTEYNITVSKNFKLRENENT